MGAEEDKASYHLQRTEQQSRGLHFWVVWMHNDWGISYPYGGIPEDNGHVSTDFVYRLRRPLWSYREQSLIGSGRPLSLWGSTMRNNSLEYVRRRLVGSPLELGREVIMLHLRLVTLSRYLRGARHATGSMTTVMSGDAPITLHSIIQCSGEAQMRPAMDNIDLAPIP